MKNKLEIFLITYNRAEYLESTLKQLLDSPVKDCKITIIDNQPHNLTDVYCCLNNHQQAVFSKLVEALTIIEKDKV